MRSLSTLKTPGVELAWMSAMALSVVVVDDPVEGNVSIFHDDVDGMKASRRIICDAAGHQCDAAATGSHRLRNTALVGVIFPQAGLRIDAVVDGGADTIVVRRMREDFDLVVDRFDSWSIPLRTLAALLLSVGREA